MKVLVVNNAAPFIRGGAEELADHLVRQLNATPGVESELLRVPFKWTPTERLIDEVLIHRRLRLINVDRVIALKFPAYLVPHEHKTLWLLHQFRQAYDLSEAGQGLSDEGREGVVKQVVRQADNDAFAACRRIFVNSPVTQSRLKRYNDMASEVLYPPLNDAELFTGGAAGDYIFAGGRVAPGKRQHLLIEAMAKAPRSGLKLLIAGPAESEAYADDLKALIARHDLGDRVRLALDFHPRETIAGWVNGAAACAYIPFDEDSLGYVTMEAFAAGKPVLTTTDAGGLLEVVSPETGLIAEPDTASLADALHVLSADPTRTAERGRAAHAVWAARGHTWPSVIAQLLS